MSSQTPKYFYYNLITDVTSQQIQPITKTDSQPSPNKIGDTATKLLIGKLLAGNLCVLVWWGHYCE